jgi:hypothetical protein
MEVVENENYATPFAMDGRIHSGSEDIAKGGNRSRKSVYVIHFQSGPLKTGTLCCEQELTFHRKCSI